MAKQTGGTPAVALERRGHALIARAGLAEMGDETVREMNRLIDDAVRAEPGVLLVVLDLSRVSFISSLGLGGLVHLVNQCKARQQALKLAGLQPKVRQEFCVTRLDRLFQLAESVEAAMG